MRLLTLAPVRPAAGRLGPPDAIDSISRKHFDPVDRLGRYRLPRSIGDEFIFGRATGRAVNLTSEHHLNRSSREIGPDELDLRMELLLGEHQATERPLGESPLNSPV